MTLVEFLRARITEDEADAREAHHEGHHWLVEDNTITLWPGTDADGVMGFPLRAHARHAAYWQPARVLAECEAKRKIIDEIFEYEERLDGEWGDCCDRERIKAGHCQYTPVDEIEALRILALPYAEHEEYLEEWRP